MPNAQLQKSFAKIFWKTEIEPLPQCAIPHENQSRPQILREWLRPPPNEHEWLQTTYSQPKVDHARPQAAPSSDAQPRATADAPGWMALGGHRRPQAAPSDCCSEPRRNRQLWGAFVVSSNNDAKVPLKQMTKFLGNSTYKVSLKKTLGGWQKFCLMKIDIYSFM